MTPKEKQMNIKELCKLTREYGANNTTLELRKSDLDFYTQKWKQESLKKEIYTLSGRQLEIEGILIDLIPTIKFN